jgi:hypothetical protein
MSSGGREGGGMRRSEHVSAVIIKNTVEHLKVYVVHHQMQLNYARRLSQTETI